MTDSKKIFIADDDPDILEILRMMLSMEGYEVTISTQPHDIFELEILPDLILLDIWMSGFDGRDICFQLKNTQRTKNIPVLFVSANSNIREITLAYNADGFVAKPFDMDELLRKIAIVISNRSSVIVAG